jgi:hypothetical protein
MSAGKHSVLQCKKKQQAQLKKLAKSLICTKIRGCKLGRKAARGTRRHGANGADGALYPDRLAWQTQSVVWHEVDNTELITLSVSVTDNIYFLETHNQDHPDNKHPTKGGACKPVSAAYIRSNRILSDLIASSETSLHLILVAVFQETRLRTMAQAS